MTLPTDPPKPHGALRIGTCSWAEQSLIESGAFYPESVRSAEQRLRYYASHFDTVEVDSTFYAIPTHRMVSAWIDRTPPGFLFHLKAPGPFTGHGVDPRNLPPEIFAVLPEEERACQSLILTEPCLTRELARRFVEACQPLKEAHRLGFVVFQFPPWFGFKRANLEFLLYCKELMAGLTIAVEFRHGSWLTRHHAEATFDFLRRNKITYITCDEPQYGSLATAPLVPEATTSVAYLRLHGRNAENWLTHATPRYDYLYPPAELSSLAQVARQLGSRARLVFVMFNNCYRGHAARNALQMLEGIAARENG